MITCSFLGGIGNNLFQMAALLNLAEKSGYTFFIPTFRKGWPDPLNFKDMFEYPYIYQDTDFISEYRSLDMCAEEYNRNFGYKEIPAMDYMRIVGYFQSEKYFKDIEGKLRTVYFKFNPTSEKYISDKYGDLLSKNVVSLHVRIGYDKPGLQPYHPNVSLDFYKKALSMVDHDFVMVFSDDISLCKENLREIDNLYFVEDEPSHIDLTLMSKCKNNILCNSTFSWWGAWLNASPGKRVIAPKSEWFGPLLKHLYVEDMFPPEWITL